MKTRVCLGTLKGQWVKVREADAVIQVMGVLSIASGVEALAQPQLPAAIPSYVLIVAEEEGEMPMERFRERLKNTGSNANYWGLKRGIVE